jgi:hypothetical protein
MRPSLAILRICTPTLGILLASTACAGACAAAGSGLGLGHGIRDGHDARIEAALGKSGANRDEIARFLATYESSGDPEKRDAARWLVANMDGHGFARIELCASDGRELGFNALSYGSLGEAQAKLDELEKAHPGSEFRQVEFLPDLEHARAELLAAHLEGAFDAWRNLPWAKSISYEAFREHILPYRGSNEPLEAWRAPAAKRLEPLVREMRGAGLVDVRAVGEKVRATSHPWVGFSDLYYVHPTDQGWTEMCEMKRGRCEDITNMVSFAMRSVATMCASDYTPWWAASDNNHAWEVVLDEKGEGRAGLAGRAAKVYRKTFAHQESSLGAIKREDETVPRWLASTHYIDVTAQYQPVSAVTVRLEKPPEGQRFAYVAVFNGGAWRPIDWGRIVDAPGIGTNAAFRALGRNICYLPMFHVDGADVPAGPPFVLDADGIPHTLKAGEAPDVTLVASTTKPDIQDPDTGRIKARTVVKPDAAYELFVWRDGGWRSVGRREKGEETRAFEGLAPDGLYWLVEDGSSRLERIFTIDAGGQVFW